MIAVVFEEGGWVGGLFKSFLLRLKNLRFTGLVL